MSKVLFLTILLFGLIPAASARGENWWNGHWPIRRTVIVEPQAANDSEKGIHPGREGAYVTFLSGGECKPDGSDLRVTGLDGRAVKFMILSMGPGDLVRLAFDGKGTTRQRYFIYYGNPEAKPEKSNWRPRGGLLLETWKYAGGPVGTAEQIKATVETARESPPIGRTYIPAIFVGENIFGPEESQTCSLYSGLLPCRQSGAYTFVISTIDASALFIDDKPVVSWPGRHGWVGDIRHQDKIELKAGLHKLAFYHVNRNGRDGAVAAWIPPGTHTARILDANLFLPIARGQLGPLEKHHKEWAADFTLQLTGFAQIESGSQTVPMFKYLFSLLNPEKARDMECQWNFSDGQTAGGTAVEHVFFREGLAAISLHAKKGTHTDNITNNVYIGPNRLNPDANAERLSKFEPVLSGYEFSKMSPVDASILMDYFLIIDRPEKAIRVGRSMTQGSPLEPAKEDTFVRCIQKTAELIVDQRGDYAQAAQVTGQALKRLKPTSSLFPRLAAATAGLYINTLGDDNTGEQILISSPRETPITDKSLLIAWGDLYRFRGDRNKAEQYYKQAQSKADLTSEFPRGGGYVTSVEDYLRRKEYSEARKLLDRWQGEFPTERLGGYSCLLRYRLYTAQKHYSQAKLLAKIILRIDPFGFYARQIEKEAKNH